MQKQTSPYLLRKLAEVGFISAEVGHEDAFFILQVYGNHSLGLM